MESSELPGISGSSWLVSLAHLIHADMLSLGQMKVAHDYFSPSRI